MANLFNFAQGIRLLIGILVLVVLCGGGIFIVWTSLKILAFRRQQRKGDREERSRRFDANGQARPPRASGVCNHCGRVFDQLNYMTGNDRICDECMEKRTGKNALLN
ncbi:MAG: hypothetical protein IPK83_17335 [Planctomycetes bacterium]|nr:hypothetical protein [Planctomycetota bacterium]